MVCSKSSDEGEGIDPDAAFVRKSKKRLQDVEQIKNENGLDPAQEKVSNSEVSQ